MLQPAALPLSKATFPLLKSVESKQTDLPGQYTKADWQPSSVGAGVGAEVGSLVGAEVGSG